MVVDMCLLIMSFELSQFIYISYYYSLQILNQIQILMALFFYGWKSDKKKYHWASRKNFSYPTDEGGVRMSNLEDVCLVFPYKQSWIYRI